MVLVSYDVDAGATYVEFNDAPVARTVSVSDLVMVDVNEHDEAVGVEFAVAPAQITQDMVDLVAERFPRLKGLQHREEWLLTRA